jgi:hypothetical protein
MKVVQLDFFPDFFPSVGNSNDSLKMIGELKSQVEKLGESNTKVRKSLFARHGELAKLYIDIHNRLEILERNICKGK